MVPLAINWYIAFSAIIHTDKTVAMTRFFGILLTIGNAFTEPADITSLASVASQSAANILILSTMDGQLHGINKITRQLIWTKAPEWGPLVKVVDTHYQEFGTVNTNSRITFIPEPINDGDLYLARSGQDMKVQFAHSEARSSSQEYCS